MRCSSVTRLADGAVDEICGTISRMLLPGNVLVSGHCDFVSYLQEGMLSSSLISPYSSFISEITSPVFSKF